MLWPFKDFFCLIHRLEHKLQLYPQFSVYTCVENGLNKFKWTLYISVQPKQTDTESYLAINLSATT